MSGLDSSAGSGAGAATARAANRVRNANLDCIVVIDDVVVYDLGRLKLRKLARFCWGRLMLLKLFVSSHQDIRGIRSPYIHPLPSQIMVLDIR